ncbi:hypothetical protein ACH5RR_032664 [Cinchona calisaya]|uniref:Uncharacterized protein n=1 Tax=Cinchona calisaya TaxID=153742 RepID=A0ABD2YIQ8_9GENT
MDENGKLALYKDILLPYDGKESSLNRCRFDVDYTDGSGAITATVFADLGESLLGFTAVEGIEHFLLVFFLKT